MVELPLGDGHLVLVMPVDAIERSLSHRRDEEMTDRPARRRVDARGDEEKRPASWRQFRHRPRSDAHVARSWTKLPGDDPQKARCAAAGRTDECCVSGLPERQRNVAESGIEADMFDSDIEHEGIVSGSVAS